jgi:hypothetical protein
LCEQALMLGFREQLFPMCGKMPCRVDVHHASSVCLK